MNTTPLKLLLVLLLTVGLDMTIVEAQGSSDLARLTYVVESTQLEDGETSLRVDGSGVVALKERDRTGRPKGTIYSRVTLSEKWLLPHAVAAARAASSTEGLPAHTAPTRARFRRLSIDSNNRPRIQLAPSPSIGPLLVALDALSKRVADEGTSVTQQGKVRVSEGGQIGLEVAAYGRSPFVLSRSHNRSFELHALRVLRGRDVSIRGYWKSSGAFVLESILSPEVVLVEGTLVPDEQGLSILRRGNGGGKTLTRLSGDLLNELDNVDWYHTRVFLHAFRIDATPSASLLVAGILGEISRTVSAQPLDGSTEIEVQGKIEIFGRSAAGDLAVLAQNGRSVWVAPSAIWRRPSSPVCPTPLPAAGMLEGLQRR